MSDFCITAPFTKFDDEEKIVTGWASVVTKGGMPVVDLQGDLIDVRDLRKAVEGFLDGSRDAGYMHSRGEDGELHRIGKIVDSLIITKDVAATLGMDTDQEGWIISMRVENDRVWDMVKGGELSMFSIGGVARKVEAEEAEFDV